MPFILIFAIIICVGLILSKKLLPKLSKFYSAISTKNACSVAMHHISTYNYFMPLRVPCFVFNGEADKLVSLLDDIPCCTLDMIDNLILTTLDSISPAKLENQLNEMTTFQLECLHCTIGWLLHLIYFHLTMCPIQLQSVAITVAKRLGVVGGGCSNVSFTYNWQHVHLKPGSLYDPRTLSEDCIEPRFILLPQEEGVSIWHFIKGHILMEAKACNIFDYIMKLYEIDFSDDNAIRLEALAKSHEALQSISLELKTLVKIMSSYMHKNKILLKHWPQIQRLVILPLYDGFGGIQNCWIFALSYATNGQRSKNGTVDEDEEAVWGHLLPHQMALMLKFKERSNNLMILCKHFNDDKIFTLYENFLDHMITWRAIHRSRASQFTSTLPDTFGTTLSTDFFNLRRLQKAWDNRIKDFVKLKSAVRTTTF